MKQFVLEFKNLAGQQQGVASITTARESNLGIKLEGQPFTQFPRMCHLVCFPKILDADYVRTAS